jgi:hypothetical protein
MKTYHVIITIRNAITVNAESEEQAMEIVRSQLPPREAMMADIQIAREVEEI